MTTFKIANKHQYDYPKSLFFFDTETQSRISDDDESNEIHEFRLGVCIYVRLEESVIKREVFHFYKTSDFWKYIISKSSDTHNNWVFAHNIKFDLISVEFDVNIRKFGFVMEKPIINNNFILFGSKGKKNFVFADTFNYLRLPLRVMGKKFGLDKGKIEDFNNVDTKTLLEYCENDVMIIERFIVELIKFLRVNQLGSLRYSIASTAFNVYRTKFLDEIYYHDSDNDLAFERNAYFGGRTDCFKLGSIYGELYYLDVNSMYPYSMTNYAMPTELKFTLNKISLQELQELRNDYYLIIECVVSIPEIKIAPFCVRENGKLIFPTGTFRVFLHDIDIEHALEHNYIISIERVNVYSREYIFREYVDFFYNIKSHAQNQIDRELSKLFLNSLYGRFALRKYFTDVFENDSDDDIGYFPVMDDGKLKIIYRWFDMCFYSSHDETIAHSNINVAIAGAVTAVSRNLLYRYILIAGMEHVFYTDTDSLILDHIGFSRLQKYLDSSKLGYLKIEGVADRCFIFAPKNYIFGSKMKSKGIPVDSIVTDGKYEYWRFSTLKDFLRQKEFGRKKVEKVEKLIYNKGVVSKNGEIKPYRYSLCLMKKKKTYKRKMKKSSKMKQMIVMKNRILMMKERK